MKKLLYSIGICCLLMVLLMFYGCSVKKKSRVNPPLASLDIPFESHRFNGDSGLRIRLKTGTEISIEPGSFVDEKGNVVRGEIDFRVREFHRAEDVLRAGIPMNTRDNGTQQLQSAGMMEMRAFANKQELSVAPGKSLGIGLAGYRNAEGYDLWYMEDNADWNVRGNFRTDSNRIKWETIRSLSDTLKNPESPLKEEARIFELVGNVELAPYLKAYEKMKWRLDDAEPVERLQSDIRIHWEKVRVELVNKNKNLFRLTFFQFDRNNPQANSGVQKTMLASPLTSKTDLNKRMEEYEKEIAALEQKKRARIEQLAQSNNEADLIQYFSADRMGIWNIDRLMKMEECTPVIVHFDFEKSAAGADETASVIALYDSENSIVPFKRDGGNKQVYLQKGKAMRLVVLLADQQIALVENESIQQALKSEVKEITFQTKHMSLRKFLMP
jgi:hypothetical protein